MTTPAEKRILQSMFFDHPGGRILERILRDEGHVGASAENEQERIEQHFAMGLLADMGCNIIIGREHIVEPSPQSPVELNRALGVKETP